MKKIYKSLFIALVAASGLTACNDYDAPDVTVPSAITIVEHETTFPAAASTGSIKFEAKDPVTVTSSSEWLTASVDGNVINIAVAQNNSLDGRAATLTVKSGNASNDIQIVQSGLIFKFDAASEINVESDPATYSYDISSNAPIEVSTNVEWISAAIADGALNINVAANPTLAPRQGAVSVSSGNSSIEIPVTQKALTFPLFKVAKLRVDDALNTKTYEFKADIPVTFTSDVDWVKGEFADNTVTVTVEPNETGHIRYANLTYEVAGETGTLPITQVQFDKDIAGEYYFVFYDYFADMELTIFPAEFSKAGSDYVLKVVDTGWSNTLLTIPVEYNDESLTVTMSSNPSSIGRYGNLYLFLLPATLDESNKLGLWFTRNLKMTADFKFTVSSTGTEGQVAEFENVSSNAISDDVVNVIGYSLTAFNSNTTLSNDTSKGNLEMMLYPSLMRLYNTGSEAAAVKAARKVARNAKCVYPAVPFKKSASNEASLRRLKL